MKIKSPGFAGSITSSDVLVKFEFNDTAANVVIINSSYYYQFGREIHKTCMQFLDAHNLTHVKLVIQDQGAILPVLQARLITALKRSL